MFASDLFERLFNFVFKLLNIQIKSYFIRHVYISVLAGHETMGKSTYRDVDRYKNIVFTSTAPTLFSKFRT